jgi:hypothetical protein
MFRLPKLSQFNVNDQNDSNSLDSFDQDNGQSSFDSLDPFDTLSGTVGWSPWFFRVDKSVQSFLGWGTSVAPSSGFASGDRSAPSVSVASRSSPGGSVPTARTSALSSPGSASPDIPSVIVSTPGSGLVFDNTYLSSCTAAFEACIVVAEKQLESLFTNSDTIVVSFQEKSSPGSGFALTNGSHGVLVSYAKLKAALLKVAPGDVLPSSDPSGGANWYVPYAYARMLGLSATTGAPDLTVTLNTADTGLLDYGQDVINGLTHELSEGGMGRIGGLGGKSGTGNWSTMDLFHYTAAGVYDTTDGRDGQTTYFSSDGGTVVSDQNDPAKGAPTLSFHNGFNTSGTFFKGDNDDWKQTQVFGSTAGGETLTLVQSELDVMEALGWKLSLKQDVFTVVGVGGWETPTDWSTGSMPITPQDAYITSTSGETATAILNSNVTVNSIAVSAGSSLTIGYSSPSTLIAIDGTTLNSEDTSSVASRNLGTIYVETDSALQIGGTFDNENALVIGKGAGGSGGGVLYLNNTVDPLEPVTLDGGGTLTLGDTTSGTGFNYGDIQNAPHTSGDDLANVDNTIAGGGVIDLGSFDNQADGKVEASQAGGFWLQISAATFTNEGFMTAESGATLNLGGAGATETLTNSGNGLTGGAINIDSGADLAISGDFTVAGSGAIAFKGAGADITSDGAGATTFTNESAIALEASLSSSGPFSGQIGDEGIRPFNDLTFVNTGTTGADGSGYALTINTGGNTVVNGSSGALEAEDGATLAIVSNTNNQGVIEAGTSPSSSNGASTGTVDLGQDGATGSMTNTGAGAIAIYGDSDVAISGNYTISGSGTLYFEGAGGDITSDGNAGATLTNASSIEADASGQIGDEGVLGVNDLTLVNTGATYADGSGVTLTLNTGATAIDDGGGTLEAESGASLAIKSNVDTGVVSGTGGTIDAATGGTVFSRPRSPTEFRVRP